MPGISREEVAHLAKLARLELKDEELDHFAGQLDDIIGAVARVSEVADQDVPPTSHPLPLTNVMRPDEVRPSLTPEQALSGAPGPVLAVSDWMRQVPDQISQWVEQDWSSLGTDGFGLSDTRDAARRHFGVDAQSIVVASLAQLAKRGEVPASAVKEARERYGI